MILDVLRGEIGGLGIEAGCAWAITTFGQAMAGRAMPPAVRWDGYGVLGLQEHPDKEGGRSNLSRLIWP